MYTWKLLRVGLKHSHHTQTEKSWLCEVMYILIILILVIIPQCMCISNHHSTHFKYIQLQLSIIPYEVRKNFFYQKFKMFIFSWYFIATQNSELFQDYLLRLITVLSHKSSAILSLINTFATYNLTFISPTFGVE